MAEGLMQELHRSLGRCWWPEDMEEKIRSALANDLDRETAGQLSRIQRHRRRVWWNSWASSMSADFTRPVGMGRQPQRVAELASLGKVKKTEAKARKPGRRRRQGGQEGELLPAPSATTGRTGGGESAWPWHSPPVHWKLPVAATLRCVLRG
jgi:hypothetical protein